MYYSKFILIIKNWRRKIKNNQINILIVDDHPIVREGLKQLISNEKDIIVSGSVEDANKALEEIKNKSYDLLIIDISLKGSISGLELTKTINNSYPNLPILILSMYDESIYAERAIRAGARGYIMKHEMTGTIVKAIRRILEGKIYLSDEMSSKLLNELIFKQGEKVTSSVEKLTDRELEVFQLIGDGFKTQDIAVKLCLSVKTIDTYRMRIKEKLNINDSVELTKIAIEWVNNNKV